MHSRLTDFLAVCAGTAYPEPRTPGHDSITETMAPVVASHLEPGAPVLDVGCGSGPALEWFVKHGFDPLGIAMGMEDVTACQRAGLNAMRMDMHEMPFEAGDFDCVWARHVLEHSIIPFFVLAEFFRILAPGGILYAEMPAPGTASNHEANPNHFSVLGIEAWKCLIVRAGFDLVEVRSIGITTPAGPDTYFSIIAKIP